jgi:hypothetical protein
MQNSKGFWTGSPGRGFLLGALALAGIGLAGGGDASAANFKDALQHSRRAARTARTCDKRKNPIAQMRWRRVRRSASNDTGCAEPRHSRLDRSVEDPARLQSITTYGGARHDAVNHPLTVSEIRLNQPERTCR